MPRNRTQIWRSGGDANLHSSRAAFFRQAQTYAAQYGRELLEHATEPDIDLGKSAIKLSQVETLASMEGSTHGP